MNFEDIYREMYYKEEDRKSSISGSLSLPVGIVGLLIGANLAILSDANYPFACVEVFILFFSLISLAMVGVSVFFLIRASWGYFYKRLPHASDMVVYHEDLRNYYVNLGCTEEESAEKASQEAHLYYCKAAAESATKNADNNDKKSSNIHNAITFIIIAIIFTSFSAVPYSVKKLLQPLEIVSVNILNAKDFK